MTWRLIHVLVAAALVLAAADVYRIKFDSTRQVERVAKLRTEIRRERDAIAALRATWSELDRPERIQILAKRHLTLRPAEITQYDSLERLPERLPQIVPPGFPDPIGAIIESQVNADMPTGSVSDRPKGR